MRPLAEIIASLAGAGVIWFMAVRWVGGDDRVLVGGLITITAATIILFVTGMVSGRRP